MLGTGALAWVLYNHPYWLAIPFAIMLLILLWTKWGENDLL